jgi:hypothetical protein
MSIAEELRQAMEDLGLHSRLPIEMQIRGALTEKTPQQICKEKIQKGCQGCPVLGIATNCLFRLRSERPVPGKSLPLV